MKKIFILSLLAFLAFAGYSQNKRMLTYDEALGMALANNPQVEAAGHEREAAEREKKAAFGLRMPNVGITGAYMFMGSDIELRLNQLKRPLQDIGGAIPPSVIPNDLQGIIQDAFSRDWNIMLQDRDFGTVQATATLPLFTGGKINAANRAARIRLDESIQKGAETKNTLVSELTERYFGLSLAVQVAEVRRQAMEGMRLHLEDAKAMEANGVISYGERLYAEVYAKEAEIEYIKALKQAETLNGALGNTLNTSGDYSPATSMFILDKIESAGYFKDMAMENNPLLKQVSLAGELAQENVRLQRSEFLPQIAAMGNMSLYNHQVSKYIPKWSVGAGVNFKIFDGLNREYKLGAAKSTVRQVDAFKIKANNDITTLIDKLYNDLYACREQMPAIDAAHKFAAEYLRIKEEAFKEGISPSSEVVDARLNLARIKAERLQVAYLYDTLLARLLEAAGCSESITEYARRPEAVQIRY